jgi:aminoglycoside phosphotransferase (APT) family kinase protein
MSLAVLLEEVIGATAADTGETARRVVARSAANTALVYTDHFVTRVGLTADLNVAAEHACSVTARAGGVPAPEVVATGRLSSGRAYLVSRRIAGWRPRSRAALCAAGELLARLHRLDGRTFPAEQHCRRRRRDRYPIARTALALLDRERRKWAEPALERAADDWLECRAGPVHGDFGSRNLLARGDTVIGIVDWTDARQASPETDLGQVDLADLEAVWVGYRSAGSARIDFSLVAGHSLARYLALESFGVFPAGTSMAVVDWWRGAPAEVS